MNIKQTENCLGKSSNAAVKSKTESTVDSNERERKRSGVVSRADSLLPPHLFISDSLNAPVTPSPTSSFSTPSTSTTSAAATAPFSVQPSSSAQRHQLQLSTYSSSEVLLFDLRHHRFVVIFQRILPALRSTYKNACFEMESSHQEHNCCLVVKSFDWNCLMEAKKLISNLMRVTVEANVWQDYETVVNAELAKVKVPKKQMLGKLRDVFIDCNNVSMAFKKNKYSWTAVKIACDYFESLGHNVTMIVPTYRKKMVINAEERQFVECKERNGQLKFVASSSSNEWKLPMDDQFLLQSCYEFDGVIVSNDRFLDFSDDPKFRNVLQNRLIPFLFIQDKFIASTESLSRKKIDVEKILLRTSPYQEECQKMGSQPCPYAEKCNYGKKCKYYHEKPPETRGARNRRLNRMLGPKSKNDVTCHSFYRGENYSAVAPRFKNDAMSSQSSSSYEDINVQYKNNDSAQGSAKNEFINRGIYFGAAQKDTAIPEISDISNEFEMMNVSNNSPKILSSEGVVNETEDKFTQNLPNSIWSNFDDRKMFTELQFLAGNYPLTQGGDYNTTYSLWNGPIFDLSPSKSNLLTNFADGGETNLGVVESTKKEPFSYFSDSSSSSCDEAAAARSSHCSSPQERCSIADQYTLLEGSEDFTQNSTVTSTVWNTGAGEFTEDDEVYEKNRGTEAKSATDWEGFPFSYDAQSQNVATFQTNWNTCFNLESGRLQSFSTSDEETARNRVSSLKATVNDQQFSEESTSPVFVDNDNGNLIPKKTDLVETQIVLSRVQDYSRVMQVLNKGKEGQVLAVMKRHPHFTPQEIVKHVLQFENCELARRGNSVGLAAADVDYGGQHLNGVLSSGALVSMPLSGNDDCGAGKGGADVHCCWSLVQEVELFVKSCIKLTGGLANDQHLARAFFMVDNENPNYWTESSVELWRQVLKVLVFY